MAGMPAMDGGDEKPKKGIDLAIIMGKPKGGAKPSGDEPDGDEGGDDLPPGFESAFAEVFPEAADDKDKMLAMKRLIASCGDY